MKEKENTTAQTHTHTQMSCYNGEQKGEKGTVGNKLGREGNSMNVLYEPNRSVERDP